MVLGLLGNLDGFVVELWGITWKTIWRCLESWGYPPVIYWLVVWNMAFIFHFIYGMSSFPLTNSMIFQDGRYTTKQSICRWDFPMEIVTIHVRVPSLKHRYPLPMGCTHPISFWIRHDDQPMKWGIHRYPIPPTNRQKTMSLAIDW